MADKLEELETQAKAGRNYTSPPLHLWHPPLSGDIAIRIDANGDWFHEGVKIQRDSLVRLFASILRREEDGHYYLVTPGEKWRLQVESHPLMVVDFEAGEDAGDEVVTATLNTGRKVAVGPEHPLYTDAAAGDVAALELEHGLTALCTRAAWYRLVEMATVTDGGAVIRSSGRDWCLGGEAGN